MIQFVEDRAPQGTITGPYRPVADQTKFRSIYGVVDGPQGNHPWTGQMIENGEIYSADGKLRMGGTAVLSAGKFHDVKQGNTTLREYQIPIKQTEVWNKYEAEQGRLLEQKVTSDSKVDDFISRVPAEYLVEHETIEEGPTDYGNGSKAAAPVVSTSSPKAKKPATQKQLDAIANARAAAAAKRAAKNQPITAPTPT